jgi:SAM-dependent methyltransferase
MPETGYFAADADARAELARLRLIEAECDRDTLRYLDAIGVGNGWRCLEVGAGGGSIVRWLGRRVGPTGHVVAADIDPRFVGDLQDSNIEVRRCDITRDAVEPGRYDLVHSRLLLMHVSDPAEVLRRMTAPVRPGGWLIAEELDNGIAEALDPAHPLSDVFDRGSRKRIALARAAGMMDLRLGKVLPHYMESLGLIEMGNEGVARVFHGGDPFSMMWMQTWRHIDNTLIDKGMLTDSEAADMARPYEDSTFTYRAQLMQSVWGRKPLD